MWEIGPASATFARRCYGGHSHLFWRCIESGLHPDGGRRRLHPSEKGIEFAAQSIELDSVGVRESIEFVHRNQNRFGRVVFGDDDYVTLNHSFKDAAELVLHIRGSNGNCGAQPFTAIN